MSPSLLLRRSAALHPDTLSHLSLLLRGCILLIEPPAGSAEFPVIRQRLSRRQANIPQIAFFDLLASDWALPDRVFRNAEPKLIERGDDAARNRQTINIGGSGHVILPVQRSAST